MGGLLNLKFLKDTFITIIPVIICVKNRGNSDSNLFKLSTAGSSSFAALNKNHDRAEVSDIVTTIKAVFSKLTSNLYCFKFNF